MTTTNPADIDPTSREDREFRNMLATGRKLDPPRSSSTMTEADAEQLRAAVPDDAVRLPKGKIPCAECGQATAYPEHKAALIKVPQFGQKASGKIGAHFGYVLLSRCPDCADRRQLALKIAAAHPKASAQLGNVVTDAIEHVLVAFTILGKPLPTPEISDAELGSLIRTMSTAGRAATWQFVAAERSGLCAPKPFAHVRQDVRTTLTRAYMDRVAEQIRMRRPPVQVAPPRATGGGLKVQDGCLMCGIDRVPVNALRVHRLGGPAAAAQDVWRSVEGIAPTNIGGPGMPERVSGSVCPDCAAAVSSAGGIGASAMEIALAKRLAAMGDERTAQVIRAGELRVIGWGALVVEARQHGRPDPAPNTRPWSHWRLPAARGGTSIVRADEDTDQAMQEAW